MTTPMTTANTMGDVCGNLDKVLMKYYLCPAYAIEFALGFLGNLVVVLGYPLCLQEWHSTNIYLYNLALSDLICVCALPRLSYLYANEMEETSPFNCILNRYLLFVNMYSSVLFMVLVSLDRYLLLRHPSRVHALLTPRMAILCSVLVWIVANVEMAPMLYYAIQDIQNDTLCKDFASLSETWGFLTYSLALTVFGYILPLVLLFWSTCKISSMLRLQEESFKNRKTSFRRPLRVVQAAAYMFLVLYLPYHIMRNLRILSQLPEGKMPNCGEEKIKAVYTVTRPMAYAHSVINPVFYFLMTERFRELLLSKCQQFRTRTISLFSRK